MAKKEIMDWVSYEGIFVRKDYILKNKLEFRHIIDLLLEILKGNK